MSEENGETPKMTGAEIGLGAAATAGKKGLELLVEDIYNNTKAAAQKALKKWRTSREAGRLYTRIANVRQVTCNARGKAGEHFEATWVSVANSRAFLVRRCACASRGERGNLRAGAERDEPAIRGPAGENYLNP